MGTFQNKIVTQLDFVTGSQVGLKELETLLNRLKTEAQAVSTSLGGNTMEKEFQQAISAAEKLQQIVSQSTNVKLGKIDFAEVTSQINKTYGSMEKLQQQLHLGGAHGDRIFNSFNNSLLKTNLQLKESNRLIDEMATSFGNTVKWGISSSVFNTLTGSLSKAWDYAKNLDSSLNDIRIVTGKSADEMERFAKIANNSAKSLGASTLDYTEAALIYYQQGDSDAVARAKADVTLKTANVTGQSGQEVSEQLTAVWNGYKVSAAEAELYVDKLAAVAATTASDLEELSTGMSKVASAANIMGVDIDQLNATLATVVSVTRQAPESVGTAFKTIYSRMGDIEAGLDAETTLGAYTEKMKEIAGVNVLNTNGQLRDMGEVIEEIGEKWSSLSREQQIALSQTMAGTRQYNNLLALFDNWGMYTKALNTSAQAAGTLQKQQDIYMESTEAHLQKLETEWERLYDEVFDQKTANGFIDVLTLGLTTIGDYIEGLGGGLNALINMGAGIGQVFSKNIAKSITTKQFNRQTQKDNEAQMKDYLKNTEVNLKSENLSEGENAIEQENLERAKQLLSISKYLTSEEFQQLNTQRDEIRALELKIQKTKELKQAGSTASIEKKKAQGLKEEASYILSHIQDVENAWAGLKEASIDIPPNEQDAKEISNYAAEIQKIATLFAQNDDADNIYGKGLDWEGSLKEQGQLLKDLNVATSSLMMGGDARQVTEEQINALLTAQKTALQNIETEQRERLNNAQLLEDAENNIYETQVKQAELEARDFKKKVNVKTQEQKNQQYVETAMTMIQATTALVGGLGVLADEESSGAEKANASWSMLSTTVSTVATAIGGPVAGMIATGVTGIVKAGLEATGAWETVEEWFSSAEERFEKYQQEVQAIQTEQKAATDKLYDNKDAEKYFKENQARFNELQRLAEQGLLNSDLRAEYENYLDKVQQYNDDIIIAYDEQGNKIAQNRSAMEDTVKLLQEENRLLMRETFNEDSWKKGVKSYKGSNKSIVDKYNEENERIDNKYKRDYNNAGWAGDEAYEELMNIPGNQGNTVAATSQKLKSIRLNAIEMGATDEDYYLLQDLINQTVSSKDIEKLNGMSYDEVEKLFEPFSYFMNGNDAYWDWIYKYGVEQKKIGSDAKDIENLKKVNKATTLDTIKLDKNFILNHLKYQTENQATYTAFEQAGMDNIDGFLTAYMSGLNLGADEFKTKGVLDYDKIKNHLLEVEKELTKIFNESPELAEIINRVKTKDKKGTSSETYENDVRKEIETFLAGLSKEEFEAIEKQLPALFGVESVSAEWNADKGKAVLGKNGGNIVTSGEQQARKAARTVSENIVVNDKDKESFSNDLEHYLQETLDEADLESLDTEKFASDYNRILANSINEDGTLKEGVTLQSITDKALEQQTSVADARFENATARHYSEIEDEGLDIEDYKEYTKHIMEMADESDILADSLEDDAAAAAIVAKSTMKMNKGVETLSENFEEWNDVLKKSDKSSEEYSQALNGMKDAVADVLDVEADAIDSDFITNNLALIEQAAKGNATAIDALRDAYADEILLNITADNNLNDTEIQTLKDKLNGLQADMPKLEVGAIDNEAFIQSCQELIANAGMTAEQANQMFAAMGIEPEYKTETVTRETKVPTIETVTEDSSYTKTLEDGTKISIPSKKTYSFNSGYTTVPETVEIMSMGVNGKTPEIKSLTKKATGTMNNFSSANKGGKSGGGSKPQKIEKTKNEKDRYHDVNVKLKQISNSLDEVQQQTELLTGQDYINNLADQYGLLNKEIEKTAEKIEIAKGEQAELQAELAGKGVTFNSDGTIANYASAYDAQLARLNAIEDKYNSMNADQQEKYQETYDKAKEDWEEFLDTISRYDELVTDEIPGLEDAIREANLKQIELKVDAFNYEIDLRLNMSELERDWNAFYNKVIKDIDDDDILGNALAKLENFSTYYKENAEGVIQVNSQHVLDLIDQLEQMKNGTASIYGEDGTNNQKLALEELQKYYEQLMKDLEDVHDLTDEIRESYVDMLDEAQDKFDEQVEAFETINDLLEHDKNVISMIYGEESYSALSQFYERQEENYNKQLDFQKQQVEFWKQQMATAEEGSEAWNTAKENWLSAVNEWNAAIETAIQNLQDKYLNAINAIFQALNDKATGGMGLGYVETEWDLINKNADQYLDTVNAIYKVQELQNKYLDAIEKSTNPTQQKKLNDLMQQETDYLREQDKLSEYDLERANLKYEIALKQMALEDAQQNKSKLRLRRDSQGNYTYQYTQDEDQIASIQSEIADLYNQLYNLDTTAYKGNLEEIFNIWKELQEKMKEAAQINDPEERAAKELLIKEQYGDLINGLVEKNENLQANMYQSTMSHLFDLYNQNTANYEDMSEDQKAILDQFLNTETDLNSAAFDNLFNLYNVNIEQFEQMTEEQKDILMNSMIPQWNSGIQQMIDRIAGEGGFAEVCKDAFEELDKVTEDYTSSLEELQKQADVDFEAVKNGIDETIIATEELLADNTQLIESYNAEVEAIRDVLEQLDSLITKYEEASNAAKKATEDAKNYWLAEQNKNADVEDNIENIAADNENNQPTTVEESPQSTTTTTPTPPSLTKGTYVDVKPGTKWYYNSQGAAPWGWAKGGHIKYLATSNQYGYNIDGLGWIKKTDIVGYDTGGYTGDWNSSNGRLAMLHKKELVLNAHDTDNMLSAITIMRDLTANLGATLLNKMASITSGNVGAIGQGTGNAGVEQSVVINAEFPNATSAREIEDAINNLVNRASQHITK